MDKKTIFSLIWTVLAIIFIIAFWKELLILSVVLIVLVIILIAYMYYRFRKKINIMNEGFSSQYSEETKKEQREYAQTRVHSDQIIDAEFTVKKKEINE